jgi:pyridinium-3,5-bisthiocarboxylic acid mononucleotide nickel chelatase
MHTAYLDCFSGVSGDMLLGALLDTGVPETYLREVVASLPLDDYTLTVQRRTVQGFAATQVAVTCSHPGHAHHEHRHLGKSAPF